MNLKELLAGVACEVVQGRPDVEVKMIHFDSRKVGEGDLFIAQRGVNADGHEYITKAVAAGAVAVAMAPSTIQVVERGGSLREDG